MTSRSNRICLAVVLVSTLTLTAAAWSDPPGRVGRLNYISGAVSFRPENSPDWTPATVNYPLTIGDHLWADKDGQAEVHVGSTAFRIAANTEISFLNLDDHAIQVQLSTGSLDIRLRHLAAADELEVDTPNSSLSILRAGTYRVDVQEGGDTTATTRTGEIEVTAGGAVFPLGLRQTAVITGADSPTYEVSAAPPLDDWDAWCLARDRGEDEVASARYVPRDDIAGVEDLDQYGSWSQDADLGPVWVPAVTIVGWAPYRFGHWAWIAPWGWTWIDDAPWGFAPFHYGRWAYRLNRWAWVPGPSVFHPVYSPAMVVFVGSGDWRSGTAPGANIGWFPLGPHEPYIPPYRSSRSRLHNVDVEHFAWVNRTVPGAVTVVTRNEFTRGQAAGPSALPFRQDEIVRIPVLDAPLVPHAAPSPLTVVSRSPVAQPPAWVSSRTVVARLAPPAPGGHPQVIQVRPGGVLPAPVAGSSVRVTPGYPRPAYGSPVPAYQRQPRWPSPQYATPRPRYPLASPVAPQGTASRRVPTRDVPARGDVQMRGSAGKGRPDPATDDPWLIQDGH